MNNSEKMLIGTATLSTTLLNFYQRLNRFLFSSKPGSYPGWLTTNIEKIKPLLSGSSLTYHKNVFTDAEERLKRPFWLFVVGEGNFGKSTLINALFGQEVAEIDEQPRTWRFDRFRQTKDITTKAIVEHDKITEAHKDFQIIFKNTRIHRNIFKSDADPKELRIALETEFHRVEENPDYCSPIQAVDWPVSGKPIFENLALIDTPGLDQIFNENTRGAVFQQQLEINIYKADAILWLIHSDVVNSASSLKYLKRFRRYGASIILLLNSIDEVPICKRTSKVEKAKMHFGEYVTEIIPISAKIGFEGAFRNDENLIQESNIPILKEIILNKFERKGMRTRSKMTYMRLREVQREARKIKFQEIKLAETNKTNYLKLINFINNHYQLITIEGSKALSKPYDNYKLQLTNLLMRIDLQHGGDEVRNLVRERELNIAIRDSRFQLKCFLNDKMVILFNHFSDHPYYKNEYDLTGEITKTVPEIAIESPTIPEFEEVKFGIDISTYRISRFFIRIVGWFSSSYKERLRQEKLSEKRGEIRFAIEGELQKSNRYSLNEFNQLSEETKENTLSKLKLDFDRRFGGLEEVDNSIKRDKRILEEIVMKNAYVDLLLNILWRRERS